MVDAQRELPGTKTLNEVKRRLTEMRKSKEQLDAKLHFYESKINDSSNTRSKAGCELFRSQDKNVSADAQLEKVPLV